MWFDDDIESVLFTTEQLATRVAELGAQITAEYAQAGGRILLVSILRGSVVFAADLMRAIDLPVELDFIAASSYGNAAQSSGQVRIEKSLTASPEGKHVIVVEDILDTGRTLAQVLADLERQHTASLAAAALIQKRTQRACQVECRYVGFECPDSFIVGYGLDYAQNYRNLPFVGVLKPAVYS